jgi:SAM-dependent methyltransferase
MNRFTRDYYENGEASGISCYTDYRWLPELTLPMVDAMIGHLGIAKSDQILDFGCAKGYTVKAFRERGYIAYGIDTSEYALSASDPEVKPYLANARGDARFQVIIAKDVLEHISAHRLPSVLSSFRGSRLFVAVPLGDGQRYLIPEMEKDVTHKIRQPMKWWENKLRAAGFRWVKSSHSLAGIKDNWVSRYPQGNGFFIAE